MPTLGYNLQSAKEHFLFLIENALGSASSLGHTDHLIARLLDEAQREIQQRLEIARGLSTAIDIVAGQQAYTLPADLMGTKILSAHALWGTEFTRLVQVTYDLAITRYAILNSTPATAALPVSWCLDRTHPGQILLLPRPTASITGGLKLYYSIQPEHLHRIWNQTAITATMTHGSDSVPLSGHIDAARIAAGDEFGVVQITQWDGSSVTGESPRSWYRIAAITVGESTDTLTLEEDFAGQSGSTATFITAQVPTLEKVMPGKLGNTLALYAAGLALQGTAPQRSQIMLAQALSQANVLALDEEAAAQVSTPRAARETTPFFNW